MGIEIQGMDEFESELLKLAQERLPRQSKNFLQRAGNKLRQKAREAYKADIQRTKKQGGTGNLLKGLKRGRAYKYNDEAFQVRVKNTAPHAHLFEHGHRMIDHDGKPAKRTRYVKGRHTMGRVARSFEGEFAQMAEQFTTDLVNEGKL